MPQAADGRGQYSRKYLERERQKHQGMTDAEFDAYLQANENQFQIPKPFVAWCHLCEKGFMSIDDITKHDLENRPRHQQINIDREEAARVQTPTPKES
jgi:hypothetical protein